MSPSQGGRQARLRQSLPDISAVGSRRNVLGRGILYYNFHFFKKIVLAAKRGDAGGW